MNLKILTEEKGKLLKEYGEAVNAKDFDQTKCDRLFEAIQQKDYQIKLVDVENGRIARSDGGAPKHEIRSLETGKVMPAARSGELEEYLSDIIKLTFGRTGVQNRDLLESSGSGAYLVPSVLSSTLISYIIERSLLGRLGVKNVATSTDTTTYGAVTTLPTADVIQEAAELTEGTTVFNSRTLQMYSFRAGEILSQEWEEDSIAHPQNVIEPIVQSIAEHIDYMAVNGSGSNEPFGIDNLVGTYLRLHLGVNGAALTGYEELGALWQKACESNYEISSFVMSPRTLKEYRLLETATEEIPKPNPFASIPMIETNAILNSDTQGTSTNASKVFAVDKKGIVAGWRYGGPESVKLLVDRASLAHFGNVRIYGLVRMGLAYPYAGNCIGYVKGVIPPAGAIT